MDRSEPSPTFSLRVLVFIVFVSSAAEAQSVVVGWPQLILAAPGDDVLLRCHLEPPADVQRLTVEWSKPDLKPDPSDPRKPVRYVYVYRSGGEVTEAKLPSYAGRTELLTEQLRHGNVSLKVLNVTLADAGRYRCFIPKLDSPVKEAVVRLHVDPDLIKASTTETPLDPRNLTTREPQDEAGQTRLSFWIPPVASCLGLVLLSGGFYWFYYKHRLKKPDETKAGTLHTQKPLV